MSKPTNHLLLIVLLSASPGHPLRGEPPARAGRPPGRTAAATGARQPPEVRRFRLPWGRTSVAFSPDGKVLAGCGGQKVHLWDTATGKELRGFVAHRGAAGVSKVAFLSGGEVVASAGWSGDAEVRLWDVSAGKQLAGLKHADGGISSLAVSPDGKTLAAAGGGSLSLWQVPAGKLLRRWNAGAVDGLAFSPDGRTLASGNGDHTVTLWETATAEPRLAIAATQCTVTGAQPVAFSPDGRTLATGGRDGKIRLWDVATGAERRSFRGPDAMVVAVAFSPDGRALASNVGGGLTCLWEVETGRELRRWPAGFWSLAFSPDGKLLASGDRDGVCLIRCDVTGLVGRPGRAPGRRPAPEPAKRSARELEALWADLAGADAAHAHRAVWTFVGVPRQAVPFLRDRLHAVPPADRRRAARLLADLDSDRFAVRQKAAEELAGMGEPAVAPLERALTRRPSLDVRRRVEVLLARTALTPQRLRPLRALEVLEQVNSPEARRVLTTLAGGVPEARLTQEARAALTRLGRRAAMP